MSEPAKHTAWKKLAFPVYVIVVIALGFVVLEIGARFKYKKSYLMSHVAESSIFHHLPWPNYKGSMSSQGDFESNYVTNNRGMRGPGDY